MAIIKPINSFTKPFADTGAKNTIPDASLIGTTAGAASLSDGFPPLTMTPVAAGGVPPSGKDMNGILNQISQHTAWLNAGGNYQFDAAIAAAGGYPLGAIIYSNDWSAAYRNVLAGNTTNFNATPTSIGVSWMPHGGAVLLQTQTATAFTTAGTAPTYVGALVPAATALTNNLRAQVTFHVGNAGAASTLNLNGLGAKNIKQYDSTGALVDAILFVNQKADLVYDGTYWVVLDPAPPVPMSYSNGSATLTANTTLTLADAGKIRNIEATGLTITLPNSTTVPTGTTFYIKKRNQSIATANVVGLDNASRSYPITAVSAGIYAFTAGSGNQSGDFYGMQVLPQADLPTSLTPNGYTKLANGLLLQWVTVSMATYTTANTFVTTSFSWPIAFPNSLLSVADSVATGISGTSYTNHSVEGRSINGASLIYSCGTSGIAPVVTIFAIGY